jgi:hypothetical protein
MGKEDCRLGGNRRRRRVIRTCKMCPLRAEWVVTKGTVHDPIHQIRHAGPLTIERAFYNNYCLEHARQQLELAKKGKES